MLNISGMSNKELYSKVATSTRSSQIMCARKIGKGHDLLVSGEEAIMIFFCSPWLSIQCILGFVPIIYLAKLRNAMYFCASKLKKEIHLFSSYIFGMHVAITLIYSRASFQWAKSLQSNRLHSLWSPSRFVVIFCNIDLQEHDQRVFNVTNSQQRAPWSNL